MQARIEDTRRSLSAIVHDIDELVTQPGPTLVSVLSRAWLQAPFAVPATSGALVCHSAYIGLKLID